jgi:hypothetical protein
VTIISESDVCKKFLGQIWGLYYKHMTIVNDDSSIVSEQSF